MNAQVTSLFTARETMTRTLHSIEGATTRLDKAFGSLRGRLRSAVEFHLVGRGMDLFWRGIHRITSALPDLISRGENWAHTVDRIADITGMAAEQASELAAVAENVGVKADGLGRMMNALARSVATNGDELRDYGIRIKDSNGHLLDSYTIFQNVRQRIAAMGPSLQAAKLSQLAFGRAALESADMLTLSNDEWERQTRLARESGLILTQQGLAAAEEWERTQSRLQQAITGIGAQILQGVAPALIGLTNGVTRTINANMGAIVRFGAGLVTFLANLAADLLGVQIDTTTLIGNAYQAAADRAERLRQKVDEMSTANKRSAESHRENAAATARSREEQRRLAEELARAQRQLARERGRSAFTGGMSDVEIELFRQQKAAAVKAAQERVADARKALVDHRETMARMEGVTAAAAGRMRIPLQKVFGGGGAKGIIIEGLDQTLRDSKGFALQISDAIKDAVFGEDRQIQLGGGAPIEIRSGGLLDGLSSVAGFLGTVAGHLSRLNELLAKLVGFVPGGPAETDKLVGPAAALLGGRALWNRLKGPPRTSGQPGGGGGGGGGGKPLLPTGPASWPLYLFGSQPDSFDSIDDLPPHLRKALLERLGTGGLGSGTVSGGGFGPPPGRGPSGGPGRSMKPWWLTAAQFDGGVEAPGLGVRNPFSVTLDRVFRTWMGPASPTGQNQQDQLGSLAAIFGAGQATADASASTADTIRSPLGVVNPRFEGIGELNRVGLRSLPIDNAPGTYMGIWPQGGRKMPVEGEVRARFDWGSTEGQIRKTATWTETTARRMQYGSYSAGSLLWQILQQLKARPAGARTSSLRP